MLGTSRRGFLGGLAALITALAIVRAASLMPIKVVDSPRLITLEEYARRILRAQACRVLEERKSFHALLTEAVTYGREFVPTAPATRMPTGFVPGHFPSTYTMWRAPT